MCRMSELVTQFVHLLRQGDKSIIIANQLLDKFEYVVNHKKQQGIVDIELFQMYGEIQGLYRKLRASREGAGNNPPELRKAIRQFAEFYNGNKDKIRAVASQYRNLQKDATVAVATGSGGGRLIAHVVSQLRF